MQKIILSRRQAETIKKDLEIILSSYDAPESNGAKTEWVALTFKGATKPGPLRSGPHRTQRLAIGAVYQMYCVARLTG